MSEGVRMRRAVYPRDITLREAKIVAGFEVGGTFDKEERATLVERSTDEPWWICGTFPAEDACSAPSCIYFSEALCDWPMGRGKTCDLSLCPAHAHSIGTERDLCEIHYREFQKRCGADRINPWPPARKVPR